MMTMALPVHEVLTQVCTAVRHRGLCYGDYWFGSDNDGVTMTAKHAMAQTLGDDVRCCLMGYVMRYCATYAQYEEVNQLLSAYTGSVSPEQYSDDVGPDGVLVLLDALIDSNSREGITS